ncbi:hypothetical protein HHK36_032246 [Tetracentron sinense]|uniref:Uncharacterized protein n=1 Tax=Tetracentron sinense TaxID=13715 RepID=A0A834Y5U3_TETSI|nr:hypothetical protein HHK36_032246 [Tetracentron sinense]
MNGIGLKQVGSICRTSSVVSSWRSHTLSFLRGASTQVDDDSESETVSQVGDIGDRALHSNRIIQSVQTLVFQVIYMRIHLTIKPRCKYAGLAGERGNVEGEITLFGSHGKHFFFLFNDFWNSTVNAMVEEYQQAVSVTNFGGIRDDQGLYPRLGLKSSPQVDESLEHRLVVAEASKTHILC